MPKGLGLENVKRFSWVEQPNGRYTIFSVPIFKVFRDEKRGEVSLPDLQDVVIHFEEDKGQNLRYPRIHIGHHESLENRPGAGYLDNFFIDGDTLFSDLVEIPGEIFQEIRNNLRYPYVSAEYNADKKKINSIALLESQTPFFQEFPLLTLANEPEIIQKYQECLEYWDERHDRIIKFQEREAYMAENEESKNDENEAPMPEKDQMVEKPDEEYKCQLDADLGAKLDRLLSLVEEIHSWEQEEHEGQMGMKEEAVPSEPMPEEENDMNNPNSVAFQAQFSKFAKGIEKTVKEISHRIFALEAEKASVGTENSLKKFCQERGLDFQRYLPMLRKFSSVADRETFLETLKMTTIATQVPGKHPASGMVNKFAAQRPVKKMTGEDEAVNKFTESQRPVARKAYQIFQDITGQKTNMAQRWLSAWQSPEVFMRAAIEDPTILENLERQ